jgi:predicted transcriptional regulator
MADRTLHEVSRRERQILDALFRAGRATAAEVRAAIPAPPSYSAVRATLRILEEKGLVRHEEHQGTYVYSPVMSRDKARRSALRNVVDTFFQGSSAQAAVALLGSPGAKFSADELDRLAEIVEAARKETKS